MEDRTRDPGDSFAISSPFIHVEPFLVMRKGSFDFRLASFNYSSSSSCLSVSRAEHVRIRSTPSPFPLPGRLFSPAHEQKGGHSFLPFSFRIRDCVRVCPPFSSQRRKGKDSIDSVEADRYPHRPLLATNTHTHTSTCTCARLLLRPGVSSVRHGHESHHACHVHAHEVLGTCSRQQERKGAK